MRVICLLCAAAALLSQSRPAGRSHGRSNVISQRGIVATSSVLASQAGAMILAKGGSAVDAAIAANAVLGVVEPMMCGIGGDLFVLYRDAKTGAISGLNSSGPAPGGMTVAALRAKGLKAMPSNGIHSATVPGCVRGWEALHAKFGKLPWKELFAPAIAFAEQGFPAHEMIARVWKSPLQLPGPVPVEGELYRNPALGRAMRSIAANGADAFYRGDVAKAILATSARLGGTMAAGDLAAFQPEWVTPLSTTYRGWRLHELPPNGQGLAALSMLNMLETFQPAPDFHTKIEAMKLAYADLHYVSDPRVVKVPAAGLISKEYAAGRAKLIDPKKANCAVKMGTPPGSSDTTYLSVVDREGNIAAWIQSVSGAWGSGVTVDGMGFALHNRGSGFSFDAAHPNALEPGKRPFHTIIPAILQNGDRHIGFGIMGGPNQPLAHAQFVTHMVDKGLGLQAALEAPRFTKRQAAGCEVMIEKRVGLDVIAGLEALGHQVTILDDHSAGMGRGNAVMHDARTRMNWAASDSRADGAAVPEP